MNDVASASVVSRVCAASAQDPPLAPWYELYLRDLEPLPSAPARAEASQLTPGELRIAAEDSCSSGDLQAARREIAAAIDGFLDIKDEWEVADALSVRGAIARAAGEMDAAARSYRESLSTFSILGDLPSTIRLYHALAEARFAVGDYAAAADLHLEALTLLPGDVVLLIALGYASWYQGRLADALAYLTDALSSESDNWLALSVRGQVFAESGRPGLALADLDRCIALGVERIGGHFGGVEPSGQNADLTSARALALAQTGKRAEAEAELADALRMAPDRARTWLRAAEIRLLHGDEAQAIADLTGALDSSPPLPTAHAADARRLLTRLSPNIAS